ncbi:PD40 domain-containing protein [bacterium SCSIO 12741]|nr:PD40 domain-containing protein [bacterium SCSIO 12741]
MAKRNIKYLCWIGLVICTLSLSAQEDCDQDVSDKAKKLFDKAKDRKLPEQKRMAYLREALEIDEDYAAANMLMGKLAMGRAKQRGGGYMAVAPYYEKVVELCPEYKAKIYYELGQIYYSNKKYDKAVTYYEGFVNFSSEDDKAYSRDHEELVELCQEDLKTARFYKEAYANPVPFDPKVVRDISTNEADEYLPLLSPDNEWLFFTRRWEDHTKDKNQIYQSESIKQIERFTRSEYVSDGKYNKGEPMPAPFNTDENINYGGVSISLNNRHIYITICTPYFSKTQQKMVKNCDIYQSNYVLGMNPETHKEEWYWTEPENMGPNINTPDGWESQPSISADGRHLYFASWREGSQQIDIYQSERKADGTWGMATNLGAPINTEGNDKSPFIHTDSKTLYFSSQGHLGFGGYDIYYVRQGDDGKWEQPKNLGHPINTDEDEHGLVVSTDGKKVYFASDHLENKRTRLNVLSFELYKEAQPDQVVLVKGKVDQKSSDSHPTKIQLKNMTSRDVNEFELDSNDGSFAAVMTVKPGDKVIMKVEGENVAYNSRIIETPEEQEEELVKEPGEPVVQKMDVPVDKNKKGGTYPLKDLHYETNSSDISERSMVILDDFAEYLIENKQVKIAIHGHTDNVGASSDNLALSADRAFSVKEYLEEKGVTPQRLTFKGFGDTKPVASNQTEQGRSKNRRTEFVILAF